MCLRILPSLLVNSVFESAIIVDVIFLFVHVRLFQAVNFGSSLHFLSKRPLDVITKNLAFWLP